MDDSKVAKLIACGASAQGLTEARRQAGLALGLSPKAKSIKNGCAATLSALMQLSGISIPMTTGAGKLVNRLGGPVNSRGWKSVAVGDQLPGDVGVTFDNTVPAGADHIYLVLERIDADRMVIADNQDKVPHQRAASGQGKTPTEYFLRATPDEPTISPMAVTTADFLASLSGLPTTWIADEVVEAISNLAGQSTIANYSWLDRGKAAKGYTKGMAIAYAQRYRRLQAGDIYVLEMAKQEGPAARDALVFYEPIYAANNFAQTKTATDRLRRLFVLLLGLGMRESSGKHCCGRDMSANNTTDETAEAGLFQMSWNSRSMSPLLPLLLDKYEGRSDLIDRFRATCSDNDLKNWGGGDGAKFQKLTKDCPGFAIDFASIGLRNKRTHWGPITNKKAEVQLDADALFRQIESIVDAAVTS